MALSHDHSLQENRNFGDEPGTALEWSGDDSKKEMAGEGQVKNVKDKYTSCMVRLWSRYSKASLLKKMMSSLSPGFSVQGDRRVCGQNIGIKM